jgi:demethylmenaquinone methyltransferase/2-methoxy-6-polyprenyl-1,4-benzoquinol methylase
VAGVDSEMQRYYAGRAAEYDRVYEKPERQADLKALHSLLRSRFRGARVLEVACGTGYWTQSVASVAAEVVALDAAPETLALARSRPANAAVRFLVADAYRLPPGLGEFNAALAAFWFSHVPLARRHEFLASLVSVLAPGAHAVLVDNRYVEGSSTALCRSDPDGDSYQLRRLADGSCHRVLKNFPQEAELRSAVAGAGERFRFTAFYYYWVVEFDAFGGSRRDDGVAGGSAV